MILISISRMAPTEVRHARRITPWPELCESEMKDVELEVDVEDGLAKLEVGVVEDALEEAEVGSTYEEADAADTRTWGEVI